MTGGAIATVEVERPQFLREDEKALVTVSKDVFAVSSPTPYMGWQDISSASRSHRLSAASAF
jgi:hypothetical protein